MRPRTILSASVISLALTCLVRDLSAQSGPALVQDGLDGTVQEDGRPLFGAVLVLVGGDGSASRFEITDQEGRFEFAQVDPGDYRLSVRRAAYVLNGVDGVPWFGDEVPVALRSGRRRLSLSVARGGVIEGVVTDSFGSVLPGATVAVTRRDVEMTDARRGAPASFTTDGDGRYRAFGLRSGEYLVQAFARTSMGSGPLQRIDPRVFESITTVPARGGSTSTSTAVLVQTESVEYLPTYFGDAVAEAGATVVTVTAGRETSVVDIRLQLSTSVTLRGTLLSSDGRALPRGRLYLFPVGSAASPPGLASVPVDEKGRFERARVTAGQYRLVAYSISPSGDDMIESGVLDVRVPGAESSDLQVVTHRTRSLHGSLRVLDNLDQAAEARAGFRVSLERVDRGMVRTSFDRHEATTDRAGVFTIAGVPAGEYRVSVTSPALFERSAPPRLEFIEVRGERRLDGIVAITADTDEHIDVFLARKQADLIGTVRGSSALPGLSVFVFPSDPALRGSPDRVRLARIESSGRYEILGVPEGGYFVALVSGLDLNTLLSVASFEDAVNMARSVTLKRGETCQLDLQIFVP